VTGFTISSNPHDKHRQECAEFRENKDKGNCRYKKYICMTRELNLNPKFYFKSKDLKYDKKDCIGFENTELSSSSVWKDNRLCGVPPEDIVNVTSKWFIFLYGWLLFVHLVNNEN